MTGSMKKIAIIGAGWLGIGSLRMLKDKGYDIDVYEKNDDVGGVWHPNNCYADLKIHQPATSIEYFDFPLPAHIDKTKRLASPQVFHYLQEYCKFNEMYKYMKFNVTVTKISYNTYTNKITLYFKEKDSEIKPEEYDYVVFTGAYSAKNIPDIPGAEDFSGKILHSFDATEKVIKQYVALKDKITVVGGSKSAADFVCFFDSINYPITWLYRSAYWFSRYEIFSTIITSKMEKKWFNLKALYLKSILALCFMTVMISPKIIWHILRSFGFYFSSGSKTLTYNKFHGGTLNSAEIKTLTSSSKKYGVQGDIASFEKDGLRLKDGKLIESDIVIFCTGTGNKDKIIDLDVDGANFVFGKTINLYHGKIIPKLPHLIFAPLTNFAVGTANGLCMGAWIDKYIKQNLDPEYLENNTEIFDTRTFVKQIGFIPDENTLVSMVKAIKPYLDSGEVDLLEVLRVNWYSYFGISGVKPMRFKDPKALRKSRPIKNSFHQTE